MTESAHQARWAAAIAGALAASGVQDVIISPGSRSTPLVLACAGETGLRPQVVLDERSAAFYALGIVRATGRPVALLCTSGSAGTHYFPAVVEASRARLPLLAVTADRPAELQHRDAPQTIDQRHLYGPHVRLAIDLGTAHPGNGAMPEVAAGIVRAVLAARYPEPGPVHVNVAFRKPFEPPAAVGGSPVRGMETEAWVPPLPPPDPRALDRMAGDLARSERPLLVCGPGPLSQSAWRPAVSSLARLAQIPVCAEAASQLRLESSGPGHPRCTGFDALLGAGWFERHRPDFVLQLGAHPTASRWVSVWDALCGPRHVLSPSGWHDPFGGATAVVHGDPVQALEGLAERLPSSAPPVRSGWCELLAGADRIVAEEAHGLAGPGAAWSEPAALRAAVEALPGGALLLLANSLPIREIDTFCPGALPGAGVLHQRGAMGIDGLVAGAAGASHGAGKPLLAIVGDVALAHDAGSLALLRETRTPLALLVIDNGGGRLFEALPIGAREDLRGPFERYFLTAPATDPLAVATGFGVDAREYHDPGSLAAGVREALEQPRATMLVARVALAPVSEALRSELASRVSRRLT